MNILTRRSFLERCALAGVGAGLASLANVPPFVMRALAEGQIGLNGKKLIFIWLRGANDAVNTIIPALDPSYSQQRASIYQMRAGQIDHLDHNYSAEPLYNNTSSPFGTTTSGVSKMFDATQFKTLTNTARAPGDPTFAFVNVIPGGNGFAGLHPSCKFLAPVFNAGQLAIIHRTAYPNQSRSHFDSQRYWESGKPNEPTFKEGIFYRTMLEAIKASPTVAARVLTAVSIQNQLPLLLRGSDVAMTNLSDPNRYSLLGVPGGSATAAQQLTNAISNATSYSFPDKGLNRALLDLQFQNLNRTLQTFADIPFGSTFSDSVNTDGDSIPYNLFPNSNATNGAYALYANNSAKYVIPTNQYGFMNNLKSAALVALLTEATITGSEFGNFDTHNGQVSNSNNPNPASPTTTGRHTGAHADLTRTWCWAMYALKRFFERYGKGGPNELAGATVGWNDVVVVTFSEFARTSAQNTNLGTDHAEAGAIFVAGGAVKGRIYCCGPGTETYNTNNHISWNTGGGGQGGDLFGAASRYLKRAVDYRSVLGEIIRRHLGATQNQLNNIIPGYATDPRLLSGGSYTTEANGGNPVVAGELGIL
jgi:uncharacterized protein (DUF1501 family)